MGVLADRMIALDGDVIGVIPECLIEREVAHEQVTELHIVKSMHERKLLMFNLSDAFIVLPGGLGTLDEFFEMFTWWQLGIHRKPFGLLNSGNYYAPLIQMLDQAVNENFIPKHTREQIIIEEHPQQLLNRITEQVATLSLAS
jgi:uncharacterized protein (TIGR00730 family)